MATLATGTSTDAVVIAATRRGRAPAIRRADQRSRLGGRAGGDAALRRGIARWIAEHRVTLRWLGLPLSVAVHGMLIIAALSLVRVEDTPTGLIVDLNTIAAGRRGRSQARCRSTGAAVRESSVRLPRLRAAALKVATRLRPRARSRRTKRRPSPAIAPPPNPTVARHDEPAPSPVAREPAPSSPPTASSSNSAAIALSTPESGSGTASSTQGGEPGQMATRAAGSGGSGSATTPGPGAGGRDGQRGRRTRGGSRHSRRRRGGQRLRCLLARVRQRIQDAVRYPSVARRRGVGGIVHSRSPSAPDGALGAVAVDRVVVARGPRSRRGRRRAFGAARAVPRGRARPGAPRALAGRVRAEVALARFDSSRPLCHLLGRKRAPICGQSRNLCGF